MATIQNTVKTRPMMKWTARAAATINTKPAATRLRTGGARPGGLNLIIHDQIVALPAAGAPRVRRSDALGVGETPAGVRARAARHACQAVTLYTHAPARRRRAVIGEEQDPRRAGRTVHDGYGDRRTP